jgi:chorismate synthase
MGGNSFGKKFSIHTFGESHGPAIGVVIDGCPAGLELDRSRIQANLDRRRPGQSAIVSPRNEQDHVKILSGVFRGKTTGAPLTMMIENKDQKPEDYDSMEDVFRPSHADYTWTTKFGFRDHRGGGRSSARETAARVAAGAVAEALLDRIGIKLMAYVSDIGIIHMPGLYTDFDRSQIESTPVRCPDPEVAAEMLKAIEEVRLSGDSIGGCVTCIISNCPPGLGEPVFDKLHADLGKAILSINACKGFEIGSGFRASKMTGSMHNDPFVNNDKKIETTTNHSGGIQGGISNGMDIYFRAAFKPVATISHAQQTVDQAGNTAEVQGKGRHDPCVLPRAVPIVEAMSALVVADHLLRAMGDTIDSVLQSYH